MAVLNRALWFNGLVDDDGTGLLGTIWQKAQVGLFMDTIDAAIATTVAGPVTPTTVNNVVTWSNTTGSLVGDPGLPAARLALGPASLVSVVGDVVTWNNTTGSLLNDTGVALSSLVLTTDPRLSNARTPTAHAASHKSGGADAIKLDELAAPTDVTTLNASTTAHGLLPKLPGTTTTFLRGDGTFVAPPGGLHASTHAAGGSDVVDVKTLGGYPGGTTTFLRADGTFVIPPGGGAGGGNVNGPATSVLGRVATWNDTTGTLLADGGVLLSDLVLTSDARLTNARTPTAHATSHKAGGSDVLKLDELAAPTDVTTLNVSTTAHGLAPKLPGNTTTFLRGDGTYATPVAGGTPGGSDTQVQFNDSAAFGGDSGLTFNKTTDVLTVGGGVVLSTGEFVFASNSVLRRNTTAGSDNGYVGVNGAGDAGGSVARGGSFWVYGNQAGNPGSVLIYPGAVAGAKVEMAGVGGSFWRFNGPDGVVSLTATPGGRLMTVNSSHANGGYLAIAKGGSDVLELGTRLALSGGSASDAMLFAPIGDLYIRVIASGYVLPDVDNTAHLGKTGTGRWIDVAAVNGTIQTSDLRQKDIVDASLGLDFVRQLRPFAFRWKQDDGVTRYGLGAQDVAAIAPAGAFVRGSEADGYGMNYAEFVPVLVQAIQDLSARLDALTKGRPHGDE